MSEYVYACLHTLWIVGEHFVDMCTQYVHKYIHMYICQCVASAFSPCLYHFEKPALGEEPSNCLITFTHIVFVYSDCTDFFHYIINLADTRRWSMTAHPPTHPHTRTHTHKQYVYTYTHKRTNTNTCTPDQTHYRALCTLHHRTTYVSGPSPLLGVSRRLDLPVK